MHHIHILWHHTTLFMTSHYIIYDITCTVLSIKPPFFMTSHPLHLISYWRYFCQRIHCIDDITPTVFMISHTLYMSTSYPLYTTKYSAYFYHHSHCTCVSHPHFLWYHILCIYDIAATICLTSDTLYKVSHPQCMTSRHIIYDISCTVFMT